MPTSRRSDRSGRMSPDRSSERNGSRPPPSYEKTSRTSPGAATLSRLALSGFAAAAGVGLAWAASGPAASSAATHTANRVLTVRPPRPSWPARSEEHTSELQSQSHISYAVFCLKKKKKKTRKMFYLKFYYKKKKKDN